MEGGGSSAAQGEPVDEAQTRVGQPLPARGGRAAGAAGPRCGGRAGTLRGAAGRVLAAVWWGVGLGWFARGWLVLCLGGLVGWFRFF